MILAALLTGLVVGAVLSLYLLRPVKTSTEAKNRKLAHDLRAPIMALNVVATLEELPERERQLALNAIERLRRIADSLGPSDGSTSFRP